jgi:hypothetical protein
MLSANELDIPSLVSKKVYRVREVEILGPTPETEFFNAIY